MEKSELAGIVKRAIKEAERVERGGYELCPDTNAPPNIDLGIRLGTQAILAEIAYQLAVMNERNALEDERLALASVVH